MTAPDSWEYRQPTRVVAGPGTLAELDDLASGRVLLVTTPGTTKRGLTARVVDLIGMDRVVIHDHVATNPTLDRLDRSIDDLRGERVDCIVALGGGSALDTGKVLSVALTIPDLKARDLAAAALPSQAPHVPLVAVPTTGGTGSEVTPFATLWDADAGKKLSLAGAAVLPDAAVVDPTLTLGVCWDVTLSSGLDAYVQCFEAIWNRNATPVTSALAEAGLRLVPEALLRLRDAPGSLEARVQMAHAALFSGLAISHTRTALAHSMSYPLTSRLGIPHGLACAIVFPAVLEFNLEADDGRLGEVARRLGLAAADELLRDVLDLYNELGVDRLVVERGVVADFGSLAEEMLTPARADNNLRSADLDDVRAILARTANRLGVGVAR